MKEISNNLSNLIKAWLPFLNEINKEVKNNHDSSWINNLIECLQYVVENPEEVFAQESLLQDVYGTLNLLHSAFIDKDDYAFIILRHKYRTIYTTEQIGEVFKLISERLKENDNEAKNISKPNKQNLINFKHNNGEFKSLGEILTELGNKWKEINEN